MKLLKHLFISLIGPALVTLAFLVFSATYWGPGYMLLVVAVIMIPIAGIVGLILGAILRKKKPITRILVNSLFAFLLGLALQIIEYRSLNNINYENIFLSDVLHGKFKSSKSKQLSVGFESEIYLELPSTPTLTKELLNSRDFKEVESYDNYAFPDGPDWFPNKENSNFRIFEFTNFEKELKYIAYISPDSSTIYGFYLAY